MQHLKKLLDEKVKQFNQIGFIKDDPVTIPHRFSKKQDIEIAAFFAATLAWGNRTTIINSCNTLMQLMHNAPYDFLLQHKPADLKKLLAFKHRTFNTTDLLYFIAFLKYHYKHNQSLEEAFTKQLSANDKTTENALAGFYNYFFSLNDFPQRTQKHVATPVKKSACKRLNMFLRWMVRKDDTGVDFGIWKNIKPSQLVCPLDVHVARMARNLGLLQRKQNDWQAALELTGSLRTFSKTDPVKYDFALFGMGVNEKL
jgi:uncharacterized protein (TIGR02757 family)